MSEKTRFEHVEFDSLAEVNIYFKEHELIKPLGEDGWGIARVQYPDNIYSQYYVFTAFNLSTNKEVTGIHRAIVLVEACSLFERSIIEDMEINHQPGSGVEIADEDDDSESVSTDGGLGTADIENIFGSDDNPIVFENLAEVRKHFESKVSGINKRDWAIYRFAEELEGYPDCHVFVAVNHTVGETIDVSWAVLSKSRVPESDDMEIMDFPLISYGEDGDFEDEHQDVDDVDREDESPAEDLSENKEIEDPVEPLPTYKGHTVH